MSEGDTGDRTYDPTPHRRDEFRKQGRFAQARDAGGIAATAAALVTMLGTREHIDTAFRTLLAHTVGDVGAFGRGEGTRIWLDAGTALVAVAGPVALASAGAAVVVSVAQSGLRINVDAIGFKLDRLNPLARLKKLFSMRHGMAEAALGLIRVLAVAGVVYNTLRRELPALLLLASAPLDAGAGLALAAVGRVALSAVGALAVVSAIDYGQSWFTLRKEMRMTRKEVTDESRSQDGDPKVKARQKARARAMARKRSLASVKTADVIVTNPTHIAVALRYTDTDPAPIVVAKGHDSAALQIRAEARKHGIPILENRALARALDAAVPLGRAVPAKHFVAVARVLAYVFKLRGRGIGTARA